jgi:type IV pilus assembly protein PilF
MKRSNVLSVVATTVAFALGLAGCVTSSTPQSSKVSDTDAAVANIKLGVAYIQQGQLALAKDKLDRAVKQDPRNVEGQTAMAFLQERLNEPEEAERYYRNAQRLAPDNAEVANNYAVFLCRTGKIDKALDMFDTAARNPLYRTPWAAMTNSAVCLRSVKRNQEALPYLERALALRPTYVEAVLELGDTQLELGRPDPASIAVERYLSKGGTPTPEVLLVGVRAALATGDRTAADNYARLLRRDFPNSQQTRSLSQLMQGKG